MLNVRLFCTRDCVLLLVFTVELHTKRNGELWEYMPVIYLMCEDYFITLRNIFRIPLQNTSPSLNAKMFESRGYS